MAGNFVLGSDIDASTTSGWNAGAGFVPVGNLATPFTGRFDGLGHEINLLKMNSTSNYSGLFGYNSGTIRNVGLTNLNATSTYSGTTASYLGGLVGLNSITGIISNVSSSGSIIATGDATHNTGGLTGFNYGQVSNSSSAGSVSAINLSKTYGSGAGGLIGDNQGILSDSYSTASVSITGGGWPRVGGLAGLNQGAGQISNSYSTGTVSQSGGDWTLAGGLVGYSNNNISNSYSTSAVNPGVNWNDAGGLVGRIEGGTVSNSYSTGSVSGTGLRGGLVGEKPSGTVTSCFWDTQTSGLSSSPAGTGLTTAEMMTMGSFTGWDIANSGGSSNIWRIYEGSTAPLLRSFLTPITLTPLYNGTAQTLTNISDYTSSIGSPVTANIINTAAGLTINSSTTAGSHTATLNGFSSIQQGYDISYTSSSITGTGSAANDLNISSQLGWSAGKLTLNAQNNININSTLNGTSTASLALQYGQGAVASGNTATYSVNAPVNLPAGSNFSTKLGSNGTNTVYTVITSIGAQGSVTGTDLQGMNGNLSGKYVLGSDIDASTTSGWNAGAGFLPVGSNSSNFFSGSFDGLGHTINSLVVNRPTTNYNGLFGFTETTADISNLGLTGVNIKGDELTGGLIGVNYGTVTNAYVKGSVSGTLSVGGMVGENYGTMQNVHASVNVAGTESVGALIGENYSLLNNSYASGSVTVSGGPCAGGLVGYNGIIGTTGQIVNSYANVAVSGDSSDVGGLAGYSAGTISNTYATGTANGVDNVGGLVGSNSGSISNSYSTGAVTGNTFVGGLVGVNSGTVINSFWDTATSGQSDMLDGRGTGFTTAQMMTAANYSTWDNASTWGIINGISYPYLQYQFSGTPQIISGMVDVTGAGRTIQMAVDGTPQYKTFTGANGFFYQALPGDSVPSGSKLLTYIDGDVDVKSSSITLSSGTHLTGNNLTSNTLSVNNIGDISEATFLAAKGDIVSSDLLYTVSGGLLLGTNNIQITTSGTLTQSAPIQAGVVIMNAPIISLGQVSGDNWINLITDNLTVNGTVSSLSTISIAPKSYTAINLGSSVGGSLNLLQSDLDKFTTNGLQISGTNSTVSSGVTFPNIDYLQFTGGQSVAINAPLTLSRSGSALYLDSKKIDIDASLAVGAGGVFLGKNANNTNYLVGVTAKTYPANTIEFTNAELNRIDTTGPVVIGDPYNAHSFAGCLGTMQIVGPIDLTGITSQLRLVANSIGQAAGATITVPQLAADAYVSVNLPEANSVSTFASKTDSGAVSFANAGAFAIGTVATTVSPANFSTSGVVAGGDINLTSGGPTWGTGKTADNLTINSPVTAGGNIVLKAGNSITGTVAITPGAGGTVTRTENLNTPVLPTLAQCIANPLLTGCSTVLPSLATCTSAPTTAGCSVVLPSLATCTSAPTTPGCSAVLPSLAACISAPTTPGCSVVLPSLATCTSAPTTAGCSAVLPSLATCTSAPTTPGCSAVLPSLAACISAPATPGCSAVLPTLATCTALPRTAGCSVVLPTLAACISSPTTPGCSAVLPSLATCTSAPTTPGCSVVLPTLATCISAPTTPGCSAVLPTLAVCTASPSIEGCSVVLPTLATCISAPATAGCRAVLPSLAACISDPATLGCSVVLPTLANCTAAPTTAGCSVVLPSFATCLSVPTTPGCSAVLPSLAICTAAPLTDGCSVVLPSFATCLSAPTSPGCSVVLPSLALCTAAPSIEGCNVVLPTLATCTSAPSAAGCSAVLPSFPTCLSAPATPGCSAVLPNLATCTSAPMAQGCSVVLPSLTSCISTPLTAGCTAVLPSLGSCVSNMTAPGCNERLSTMAACAAAPSTPGCGEVLLSIPRSDNKLVNGIVSIENSPVAPAGLIPFSLSENWNLPAMDTCIAAPNTPGCGGVLPPLASCTANPSTPGCSVVLVNQQFFSGDNNGNSAPKNYCNP